MQSWSDSLVLDFALMHSSHAISLPNKNRYALALVSHTLVFPGQSYISQDFSYCQGEAEIYSISIFHI